MIHGQPYVEYEGRTVGRGGGLAWQYTVQYRCETFRNIPHGLVPARSSLPERRHGSTRVPGHVLCVTYLMTPSAGSWAAPVIGNRYCTEKAGGTARLSRTKAHLPGHSPPDSQSGQPSSLRPHWSLPTIINWLGCCPNKVTGGGKG